MKRLAVPKQLRVPLLAVNGLLAAALAVLHFGARVETRAPVAEPRLASLPRSVAAWHGKDGSFKAETVTAIGAEDWLLRRYEDPSKQAVWLYVGFHSGVSFDGTSPHSPLLCYPGQGWTVVESALETIVLDDQRSIPVNRLLVQRGVEQKVVLYWFQWGSQVTTEDGAGDYLAKLRWLVRLPFLMREAARTDRSLVRVSTRVELAPERAFASSAEFVRAVFPLLAEHLELAGQIQPSDL